jgi:hypothetical protein
MSMQCKCLSHEIRAEKTSGVVGDGGSSAQLF